MSRLTRIKKAMTIASTFSIALGIGFIMHYGDANAARFTAQLGTDIRKPVLIIDYSPLTAMTVFALKPEAAAYQFGTRTHEANESGRIKLVALAEEFRDADTAALFAQTQPQAFRLSDCDILATAAPHHEGSVLMTIVSECRTGMPFTVKHGGLSFSAQADESGTAILTVPAMSEDVRFVITFEDGKSLAASTFAPQAALYNRVVFQWKGLEGDFLRSNALEGSAVMLDWLGENVGKTPRFAQVYSFPVNVSIADGLRGIDVVADVTSQNCGQDLIAESFTVFHAGIDRLFKDIHITLPICEEVGATLELKKVLGEQKLSSG
jgi:hypothetical protein